MMALVIFCYFYSMPQQFIKGRFILSRILPGFFLLLVVFVTPFSLSQAKTLTVEQEILTSKTLKTDTRKQSHLWRLDSNRLGKEFRQLKTLNNASFVLLDPYQQTIYAQQPDKLLIPASTTKLVTALLALQHWGENYHFYTDILIQPTGSHQAKLLIKGYGDPFLVSEELQAMAVSIASQLRKMGLDSIAEIQLDSRYYRKGMKLPGVGVSDNPYDALPTALAANFNTTYIGFNGKQWYSAEPQTPLTASAVNRGKTLMNVRPGNGSKRFRQRVNLGPDRKVNERYFIELLSRFIASEGIHISTKAPITWQESASQKLHWGPDAYDARFHNLNKSYVWKYADEKGEQRLLRFVNSKNLGEVLKPMLKYSTNFIANHLALNLAAETFKKPVGERELEQLMAMKSAFIKGAKFQEGAGLSRENRLNASHLLQVLVDFEPWRHLLPEVEKGVFAKSGTLHGVTALAGFIKKDKQWFPFVLMVNEPVSYGFRNRLIRQVRKSLVSVE